MMTKEEALYKVVADLKHRLAMVKEDGCNSEVYTRARS